MEGRETESSSTDIDIDINEVEGYPRNNHPVHIKNESDEIKHTSPIADGFIKFYKILALILQFAMVIVFGLSLYLNNIQYKEIDNNSIKCGWNYYYDETGIIEQYRHTTNNGGIIWFISTLSSLIFTSISILLTIKYSFYPQNLRKLWVSIIILNTLILSLNIFGTFMWNRKNKECDGEPNISYYLSFATAPILSSTLIILWRMYRCVQKMYSFCDSDDIDDFAIGYHHEQCADTVCYDCTRNCCTGCGAGNDDCSCYDCGDCDDGCIIQ